VRLRYADFTDLSELPTKTDLHYIGYANEGIVGTNDFAQFFQVYDSSNPAPCPVSSANCTWDFYYPVPYLNGGVYELEFEGKKGESIQKLSAGVVIDGTLPAAPTIIDINKLVAGEVQNANIFDDKYYVNSNVVVITGVSEANVAITISAAGLELCHTNADAIGLFRCEVDLAAYYADLDTVVHELALETVASDGTNQAPSIVPTTLIVDKLAPEILESTATTWVRSGQSLEVSVQADEKLAYAYLLRDNQVTRQLLGMDRLSAIASYTVPGNAAEGRHLLEQKVSDLAGNTTSAEIELWIDNTAPDTSAIARVSLAGVEWGTVSGIKANPAAPASGRLLPGYVTRAESLPLTGVLESGTVLEFWQNGVLLTSIDASLDGCTQTQTDAIVDTIIVKSGQQCAWYYDLQLPTEAGYLLQVKVKDKAGNYSGFSQSVLLYADRTTPGSVNILSLK